MITILNNTHINGLGQCWIIRISARPDFHFPAKIRILHIILSPIFWISCMPQVAEFIAIFRVFFLFSSFLVGISRTIGTGETVVGVGSRFNARAQYSCDKKMSPGSDLLAVVTFSAVRTFVSQCDDSFLLFLLAFFSFGWHTFLYRLQSEFWWLVAADAHGNILMRTYKWNGSVP